jgi:hypothetical protein
MSTELMETTGRALNPFAQFAREQTASANTLKGERLKYEKGRWMYGQGNTKVAAGTTFTVNPEEILVGWQKWEGGKPTGANLGAIASGFRPPSRKSLGDTDESQWDTDDYGKPKDPWTETLILYLRDGDDDYTFPTSSYGGRNAVNGLLAEIGAEIGNHAHGALAVVEIGTSDYTHKKHGLIDIPTLKLVGWDDDGGAPLLQEKSAPAAAKQPSKTKF